jgi:hypothetical protein
MAGRRHQEALHQRLEKRGLIRHPSTARPRLMKRRPAPSASANPSVVLRAFAPETEFTLTLDGALLLEALGCAFITGGTPGIRDAVMAVLVMTDEEAVFEARRKGRFEELMRATTKDRRPADILGLADKIAAALQDAIHPAATGADPADEKKSAAAPAGGSP